MAVMTTNKKKWANRGKFYGARAGDRMQYLDTDGSYLGSITDASFAATNQDAITLANNQSDGKFAISVGATGSPHTYTLQAPVTTQTVTMVLPDIASDTLVSKTSADTLTNKTLTTPTIGDLTNMTHDHSSNAEGGTLAVSPSLSGTTENTFSIDSDNTTGVFQLKTTTGGSNYTVILTNASTTANATIELPASTCSLAGLSITGANTGYLELGGSSNGAIKIAPIASGTGIATIQNQAASAHTITLPPSTCTLGGLGLANAWTAAQSITVNDSSNTGVTDVLDIVHTTSATAGTGIGVGLTFGLEDADGNSDEAGSIDFVYSTATEASEDADIVFSTMLGGTVTAAITVDASAQLVRFGLDATDADGIDAIEILPNTTGYGSLVIRAGDDTGDNVTTLTTTVTTGDVTITLPVTTCTLIGGAAANTFSAAQTIQINDSTLNNITDVLVLEHRTTSTATTNVGVGVSFKLEDASGNNDEAASMDIQYTTATEGTEDADIIFSAMMDGTVTQVLTIDASANALVLGTDTSKLTNMLIYPGTTGSGSFKVAAQDDSGNNLTTLQNNATTGAATVITCPNATGTLSAIELAETFSGVKTFSVEPIISIAGADDGVTDLLQLTKTKTSSAGAGIGAGISVIVENDSDATTEVSSIDFVTTSDGTKTALDTDINVTTMFDGAVLAAFGVDASEGDFYVGSSTTDSEGIDAIRIYPLVTGQGSFVLRSVADGASDYVTTLQTGTGLGGSISITLPTSACTLPGLSLGNAWTGTADFQGNITASTGNPSIDFSGSNAAFTTSSGTNTFSGTVSLAANKNIACVAGSTAVDWSLGTGTFKTTTGENTLSGNVTISGSKTFTTGTGNVTIKGDLSIDSGMDFDMSSGNGTFDTGTGVVGLHGDVTIATGKDLVFTSGAGYIQMNGATAGGLKIGPFNDLSWEVTIAVADQTTGIATLTIPDLANTATEFVINKQAQSIAGTKTFTDNMVVDGITGGDTDLDISAGAGATTGYPLTLTGGAGTGVSYLGGAVNVVTGAGVNGVTAAGTASGAVSITTGAAGTTTINTAGASGAVTVATGTGGAASGVAGIGGAGGAVNITPGAGGASGDGSGGVGGAGGAVTITGGTGGVSTNTTDGAGGAISIDAGSSGDGTNGTLAIGPTNSSSTTIGRVGAVAKVQASVLTLDSASDMTFQINATDALQMDDEAISTFAALEDVAGHAVYIETEDGGAASASTSGDAGGLLNIKTGDGSDGATGDYDGAAGGALSLITGAGGACGTVGSGTADGKDGGAITITSGAGGAGGDASGGVGGDGGAIAIDAGAAGAAFAGGTAGAITIGATSAESVAIGRSTKAVTFAGVLDIYSAIADTALVDGDFVVFTDTNDSNKTKREAIGDIASLFAGSGLTASSSVIAVTAGNTHTAMYPGSFKFSLESGTLGMCLAGAVGSADITKTNVGSTYMKCMDYNTGTEAFADVSDSTGGAFTQWHYFPAATDENGDACLIGNANPFCGIYIDINQAVDYTGDALTWEFCTAIAGGEGTWSTLTIIYDKTDGTSQDGKRSFGTDGYIFFEPPGATWVPIVLDTQEAYWIRARISTNGNVGNNGTINGVEHDVVTYTNAPQMQHACTIDAVRITNHNTTVHSGSSIKFYVYNQTQHTFSTELDWPVNCFAARINLGSAMTCAAGDAISLLISQEDSGNQDPTNVTVEFELTYA